MMEILFTMLRVLPKSIIRQVGNEKSEFLFTEILATYGFLTTETDIARAKRSKGE